MAVKNLLLQNNSPDLQNQQANREFTYFDLITDQNAYGNTAEKTSQTYEETAKDLSRNAKRKLSDPDVIPVFSKKTCIRKNQEKDEDAEKTKAEDLIYEKTLKDLGFEITHARIMGKGAYARVIKTNVEPQNFDGVIKVVKLQSPYRTPRPEEYADLAENELNLLDTLTKENAPYIVKQLETVQASRRRFASIQEYAGKTLRHLYLSPRNPNKKAISLPILQNIAYQLLTALDHLHAPKTQRAPVVHSDLKPDNIVEDAEGTITLLDLGLAVLLDDQNKCPHGAKFYEPPDALFKKTRANLGNCCKTTADIWALACILFELCTGEHLIHIPPDAFNLDLEICYAIKSRLGLSAFPEQMTERLDFYETSGDFDNPINHLINSNLPPLTKFSDAIRSKIKEPKVDEFIDLLYSMLQWFPAYRQHAAQLLSHPFFRS